MRERTGWARRILSLRAFCWLSRCNVPAICGFTIGIHAAWDWAQSFVFGVPDSGITVAGHLLNPSFQGSKWMTGGTVGPEGSVVTLLGYVFAFALINFRFPETRYKVGQ